jgi:voltage-gated sodium channel
MEEEEERAPLLKKQDLSREERDQRLASFDAGPLSARSRKSDQSDASATSLEKVFELWEYEFVILLIVVLNAVSIGLQIDYPDLLPLYGWLILNLMFWFIFFIECIVKMYTYGVKRYFRVPWNVFDFVITVATCIEIAATFSIYLRRHTVFNTAHTFISGDFIEMARLARLFRLGRLFTQLGVLAGSFIASLQALGWIILGSLLWFYINACFCTVFLGRRELLPANGDEEIREIRERFETVGSSLFCLFEIMTLEGWTDYARPMLHKSPGWVIYFISFIFVSAFFLLNLVTAVVVDRTVAAQVEANEEIGSEKRAEQKAFINDFVKMLTDLNNGGDRLSRADLAEWAASEAGQKVSQQLQFVTSMAVLLDHDESGYISLAELRDLWNSYENPLSTETLIRFHINQARQSEHQERLMVTVLHVLEKMSGKSLKLSDDVFGHAASYLEHDGNSPVKR